MGNTSQILMGRDGPASHATSRSSRDDTDIVLCKSKRNSCRLLESMIIDDENSCYCRPNGTTYPSIYSSLCSPTGCNSRDLGSPRLDAAYPIYDNKQYLSSAGDSLDLQCLEKHLAPLHAMTQGVSESANHSSPTNKIIEKSTEINNAREKFRNTLVVISKKNKSISNHSQDIEDYIDTFDERLPSDKFFYRCSMNAISRKCFKIDEAIQDDLDSYITA